MISTLPYTSCCRICKIVVTGPAAWGVTAQTLELGLEETVAGLGKGKKIWTGKEGEGPERSYIGTVYGGKGVGAGPECFSDCS